MQPVINTYGAFLRKQGDCLLVKNEDKTFEVSLRKVDSILITTGAYLSTDVIKAAIEHNIEILFMDEFGEPYGRLWHPKLGSTTLIRRGQLERHFHQNKIETNRTRIMPWAQARFTPADLRNYYRIRLGDIYDWGKLPISECQQE